MKITRPPSCSDDTPRWFTGRWRDWHRGHGCDKDDGNPRSIEAVVEIDQHAANIGTGYLTDAELSYLRARTTSGDTLLVRAFDELRARRAEVRAQGQQRRHCMSPSHYDTELERLGDTYRAAMEADITSVKDAIAGASESSIIGVGSGGSFTVASLLCSLHEHYTGRVSRPLTPLEIICNPTLASVSPVFLISAEGKNPDITEALRRARMHSMRPVHVLTNRAESPLAELSKALNNISLHPFNLQDKDGYLATNSLLLDATLIARAYDELNNDGSHVPESIADLRLGDVTIDDWLTSARQFIAAVAARPALIVTFSPLLRAVATDLESKLAESALLHCQLADLRSFAHGRHLWLADRPQDCAVLALIEPSLKGLWDAMRALLPAETPTLTMPCGGAKPGDLLAGLVAQMKLVSLIAQAKALDPGAPTVAQFGRDLHYLKVSELIPAPPDHEDRPVQAKYKVPELQRSALGDKE